MAKHFFIIFCTLVFLSTTLPVHSQDKTIHPTETVRRFREKLARVDLDILRRTIRIDNGRLGILG